MLDERIEDETKEGTVDLDLDMVNLRKRDDGAPFATGYHEGTSDHFFRRLLAVCTW